MDSQQGHAYCGTQVPLSNLALWSSIASWSPRGLMGTVRVEVLPEVGQLLCLHRPQWLPGASSIRNARMCLSKWKKICLPGKPLTHVETTISFSKIGFHFMADHAVSCAAHLYLKARTSLPCSVPFPSLSEVRLWKHRQICFHAIFYRLQWNGLISYFQRLRKENIASGKHWIWLC